MAAQLIETQSEFNDLCIKIRDAGIVAFDTEFVSENTFRPELCLLQFATPEMSVAVDPFQVKDLSAWWDIMTDDRSAVIAHAGREEVRFCVHNCGARPRRLFDIQIAEGLRSRSYPMAYDRLIHRVLNQRIHNKETRTDWRRRPLNQKQIDYALDDVRFIIEVWQTQCRSLDSLNRMHWADAEFKRMIDEVASERSAEDWRRLSGIHKLKRRELAVARELYRWRDKDAEERDQPRRRVLRDDLLIDISRRQPVTERDVLSTRDMNRANYRRSAGEIVECVKVGMAVPEPELPKMNTTKASNSEEHVLGKLLAIALANRCAELNVSTSLVGTNNDLRMLIREHLGENNGEGLSRLSTGWRAEVCGDLLGRMIDGEISLRVGNARSDYPLVFEEVDQQEGPSKHVV